MPTASVGDPQHIIADLQWQLAQRTAELTVERDERGRDRSHMQRSTDRILTTHTGSLPRTTKVIELLLAKQQNRGARKAGSTLRSARRSPMWLNWGAERIRKRAIPTRSVHRCEQSDAGRSAPAQSGGGSTVRSLSEVNFQKSAPKWARGVDRYLRSPPQYQPPWTATVSDSSDVTSPVASVSAVVPPRRHAHFRNDVVRLSQARSPAGHLHPRPNRMTTASWTPPLALLNRG